MSLWSRTLRRRGLWGSAQVAAEILFDSWFDFWYGTRTYGWTELDQLEIKSENRVHGRRSQPAKAWSLFRVLRKMPLQGVFVDLGCGAGRVLCIAALSGFKEIVGVEFSPRLCSLARANAQQILYGMRHPLRPREDHHLPLVEVVEADAARYQFEPETKVIFMYNPFDRVVMEQMLANLKTSLYQHPRELTLIYHTPIEDQTILDSGIFTQVKDLRLGASRFRLYYA